MNNSLKSTLYALLLCAALAAGAPVCHAQFDLGRALKALVQTTQALTLTDAQMAAYVSETVKEMDSQNTISSPDSKYSRRLARLTQGITEADGIPLNFKVYEVKDVNAFACPDGSVRVFSALMDIMDDDELMGIIGHEIGHVMKHHSKNAFKNQLLTGAAKDAIASASSRVAVLTDSQLASLGEGLMSARYSRKQESEADDCGYDFLVAHGRNPWGMVKAFEKFQQMEQQSGGATSYMQKMFSSHPDTKARIKAMTKRCKKDGFVRP